MANINRTDDISQQKDLVVHSISAGTSTGVTYGIYVVPRAQTLLDARSACIGLSGAPTSALSLQRFVAGAGATVIAIGGALTLAAFGTSGNQQYSLPASGSTLLNLQAGDRVFMTAGGSNAAVANLLTELVVLNIQDIKTWNF